MTSQFQFWNSIPPREQRGQSWRIKLAARVPPWGGSYASQTDNFETGTFWSFALRQKGPKSGQPSGRTKANHKPAQNKKTATKCDSCDKRIQHGSWTWHLGLNGWHHTSPKTDVSGDRNCNRLAQWNIWQAGSKKRHGKQTWNCSRQQVIDADYTGELKVILQNHGNTSY